VTFILSTEIGRTPHRDRSTSGSRSVVTRVEIGRTAADLLLADGSEARHVAFTPELVVRASTSDRSG